MEWTRVLGAHTVGELFVCIKNLCACVCITEVGYSLAGEKSSGLHVSGI